MKYIILALLLSTTAHAAKINASKAKEIATSQRVKKKVSKTEATDKIRDAAYAGETSIVLKDDCNSLKALKDDGFELTSDTQDTCTVDWSK